MSNAQMQKSNGGGPPRAQLVLKHELEKIMPAMAQVLPKHLTPERMVKVLLSATNRNQDLLKCSVSSITQCVMQASELGLELGGVLGEAYLVPFKGEATCIVGYRGLLKLARNSGELASVSAHVVYRDDTFRVNLAEETILHELNFLAGDRKDADIIAVYAIGRFKEAGVRQVEIMTRAQVDAIRKRSKASGSGPWVTDYAEMARKTVVRRLCKYLPLSASLRRAIEMEEELDQKEHSAEIVEMSAAVVHDAAKTQTGRLASKIKAQRAQAAADAEPEPVPHDEDGRVPDGDYQSDADEGPPPDDAS